MILRIALGLIIGGVAGGLLGYWGKCRSGACPLTSTPWRGVLFGVVLGGLIALAVGRRTAGEPSAFIEIDSMDAFRTQVVQSERPVLVDFHAPWCPPCKQLAPVLEDVADDYAGRVRFVKVNTDVAREIATNYAVESLPTVIVFSNGEPAKRLTGYYPDRGRTRYDDALDAVLSSAAATQGERKERTMTTQAQGVTMKGNPVELSGEMPDVGDDAPDAVLVGNDLQEVRLADLLGRTCIVASVPSLDTSVCSMETKRFEREAAKLGDDVNIVVVSMDLPFAQARWCGAEGVENVTTLSDYRHAAFGEDWGVLMSDLRLLARAVFVVDARGKVRYRQLVNEVTDEPDYDEVLQAVKDIRGG